MKMNIMGREQTVRDEDTTRLLKNLHRVLVWTVITRDMKQDGYDTIQPYFEYPRNLSNDDECHMFEVILPTRFGFDDDITKPPVLYDFANGNAPVTATVGHDENILTIRTYYQNGTEGQYYRYPLEIPEFRQA